MQCGLFCTSMYAYYMMLYLIYRVEGIFQKKTQKKLFFENFLKFENLMIFNANSTQWTFRGNLNFQNFFLLIRAVS